MVHPARDLRACRSSGKEPQAHITAIASRNSRIASLYHDTLAETLPQIRAGRSRSVRPAGQHGPSDDAWSSLLGRTLPCLACGDIPTDLPCKPASSDQQYGRPLALCQEDIWR